MILAFSLCKPLNNWSHLKMHTIAEYYKIFLIILTKIANVYSYSCEAQKLDLIHYFYLLFKKIDQVFVSVFYYFFIYLFIIFFNRLWIRKNIKMVLVVLIARKLIPNISWHPELKRSIRKLTKLSKWWCRKVSLLQITG